MRDCSLVAHEPFNSHSKSIESLKQIISNLGLKAIYSIHIITGLFFNKDNKMRSDFSRGDISIKQVEEKLLS